MLEYKKATFLLESSQSKQEDEKKELSWKVEKFAEEVRKEQNTNMILIIVLAFVLMVSIFAWFMGI
jgi:cytoskeletal protein RodZ